MDCRVFRVLVGIELVIVAAYLISRSEHIPGTIQMFFDLDAERSFATWFSVLQHAAVGSIAVLLARDQSRNQPDLALFHTFAGAIFFLLSLDECAGLHEALGHILRRHTALDKLPVTHGLWMPVYLIGLAILLVAGRWWLRRIAPEQKSHLWPATCGLLIFAFGATGPELVANMYLRDPGTSLHAFYALEVVTEEFLEMCGVTVVLCSLLGALGRQSAHCHPAPS